MAENFGFDPVTGMPIAQAFLQAIRTNQLVTFPGAQPPPSPAVAAAQQEESRAKRRKGFLSTILTSLFEELRKPLLKRKTLLGGEGGV